MASDIQVETATNQVLRVLRGAAGNDLIKAAHVRLSDPKTIYKGLAEGRTGIGIASRLALSVTVAMHVKSLTLKTLDIANWEQICKEINFPEVSA